MPSLMNTDRGDGLKNELAYVFAIDLVERYVHQRAGVFAEFSKQKVW
jgi:hypothetical protein